MLVIASVSFFFIVTILILFVVVPSANCPQLLYPVAYRVPSSFNIEEEYIPVATCFTPDK